MAANFTSKLGQWQARHRRAVPAALVAALLIAEGAAKRNVTGGFTTGKHVTGRLRSSITHSEPVEEGGAWVGRVGTNVKGYPAAWEFGFTTTRGNHFHKPWLVPAVMDNRDRMRTTFQAVYDRMMAGVP